jgi:hypothetical protein
LGKSGSPLPSKKTVTSIEQNTPSKQNIIKNEPYKVAMPDKIVPCDENAYNWSIGCQNNKIKQLNLRMLGKELDGVYTDELRRSLINSGYIRSTNSEITKDLYNEIMSLKLD